MLCPIDTTLSQIKKSEPQKDISQSNNFKNVTPCNHWGRIIYHFISTFFSTQIPTRILLDVCKQLAFQLVSFKMLSEQCT